MLHEGGSDAAARARAAPSALATARRAATAGSSRVLRARSSSELAHYRAGPGTRRRSCSTVGESPRDAKLDAAELAAWTTVASAILNLDETITKE